MRVPPESSLPPERARRPRRIFDAARVLPVAGALVFLLPALWGEARTALAGVYLIGAWLALIGAAAGVSFRLSRLAPEETDEIG